MSNIDKFVILVLVCKPQTSGLHNKFFFLPVLETEKSKTKAPADLVSDEDLLPLHGPQPYRGKGA